MTIKALFPTVRPTLNLDFAKTKALDPRITFTRASTATFVGSNGLIQTAASDVPRFDHNPATGESLGLLVEEARTNLRTYSAAPNASNNYRIYGTPTYNTGVAPDGTATATLITGSGAAGQGFDNYANDYGSNQNAIQTYSVYVKNVNASNVVVQDQLNNAFYTFTFSTETGSGTGGFQKLSNGWYRVWVLSTKTNQFGYQEVVMDGGNATSNSIYVWGVQLENASFPTSYIPTVAATVTRAADVASMTGTDFSSWYRQDEGTMFVNFNTPAKASSAALQVLSIRNSTPTEFIEVYTGNNSTDGITLNVAAGRQFAFYTRNTVDIGKYALALKANNFAVSKNGLTPLTDTSGSMTSLVDRLFIGTASATGVSQLSGTIARLAYYPVRLPDATLQALTAT